MKKLLLLVLVIGGLASCGDKWLDVKPAPPKGDYLQELAYDYGIDTVGISNLGYNKYGDEITFSYLQNNKIKVTQYNESTRELVYEFEDNEVLERKIKYNVPYVGEVTDSITGFHGGFFYKNLARVYYGVRLYKNNNFEALFFIKDKTACKKIFFHSSKSDRDSGVAFAGESKWYDNSFVIYSTEWNKSNNTIKEKNVKKCYDKYGEFLFDCKSSEIPNFPINISDGVNFSGLKISRINIQYDNILWSTTINLNIPETARYEIAKYELIDVNTMQASYNITLYDGTKTTKTVNIDVTTGEYTLKQ